MEKLPVKILVVLSMVVIGAAGVLALRSPKTSAPDLPVKAAAILPTPTPTPPSVKSFTAPDGKMILREKEEVTTGGIKKTFSILTKGESAPLEIYSKVVSESSFLTVPYNTFSPDDKYIFLKEIATRGTNYYIFSTSAKSLTQDSGPLEVSKLFYDKYTDFKITDMTGWGGVDLW